MPIKASKTRQALRQAIGYNLGSIIVSTATATGSTTTLLDTNALAYGGTDDFKGRDIILISGTAGNIGTVAKTTAFDSTSKTLTVSPTLASATAAADGYELHEGYRVAEINAHINQAIVSITDDVLIDKQTATTFKQEDKYLYDCLSNFVGLHRVEYVSNILIDSIIHACNVVWDELVDGDVTASVDTSIFSGGSLKLVVAAGCGAGDILATDSITSLNIADCDELLITVYSTVALSAGDLQVLLDDTALCASAVESLNIPATSAYTKTTHVISLANPSSDSAIISVGIKMVTDKGAFTLYVKDIKAQHSLTRLYQELNPNLWNITRGTTPLLQLTEGGYSSINNDALLRLTGYQIPTELSDDTTSYCDVDPDYVIAKATSTLLLAKGRNSQVDLDERLKRSDMWNDKAERIKREIRSHIQPDTRWVS